MWLPVFILVVSWHWGSCQRYAVRTPLPMPLEEIVDDEYYSEGYDFDDNKNIYRWNVEDFPHPVKNFRYCNRMKASYICDPDMILDKEQADKLDSHIRQLYKDTPCLCEDCTGEEGGIVIGIALLKYMFQPYNEHPSQIIRSFTERLREKWNLGKCDNDILIVVATTDRLSYTDVGKSTSAHVSLQEAYRIFLENKAHLSSGHFFEGLSAMLGDYYTMTRSIKRPVDDNPKLNLGVIVGSIVGAVVLLAIILLVSLLIYRRCKRNSGKSSKSAEDQPEGERTSWTKQDIKVMFNPLMSKKYQTCDTEDSPPSKFTIDEEDEEVIDTTLATDVTDTSASELLDKELGEAVEGLAETFKPSKSKFNRHETNL